MIRFVNRQKERLFGYEPDDLTKAQRAYESTRSMIESSLDSLVAISPEGKITDVNESTVHVTGVPRNELIGTDFSQYFTDPLQADKIYHLVVAEGRPSTSH